MYFIKSIIPNGGPVMWLMLLLALVIFYMTFKTIRDLFFRKEDLSLIETELNSILFWGGISGGLGIFGHFAGIFLAMKNVLQAQDVAPAIVAENYLMSFSTIYIGLNIFIISAMLWFGLRWQFKRLRLKLN